MTRPSIKLHVSSYEDERSVTKTTNLNFFGFEMAGHSRLIFLQWLKLLLLNLCFESHKRVTEYYVNYEYQTNCFVLNSSIAETRSNALIACTILNLWFVLTILILYFRSKTCSTTVSSCTGSTGCKHFRIHLFKSGGVTCLI